MKTIQMTKALSLFLIIGLFGSFSSVTLLRAQTTNTSSGSRPVLIPNTKPYTTEGLKNATGRAGSANITVRALMAKNNTTDVEVSTGEFDTTTPAPGQLTKVQLKTLNQNDEVVYTKNYTNLTAGGYFKTTLTDVQRGQPLQIQTNVRGIDANRTGVVTVLDNVKLRPDLKAERLTAPEESVVNSLVNIAATIKEINNDTGATANCVLYVDGTAVDRADGITVGKGDTVNCAFTQRFSTIGTKQLQVSVENVTPGDYDNANNSASGVVQIISPEIQANYWASVREHSFEYIDRYEYFWSRYDGTFYEQSDYGSNSRRTESKMQYVQFESWINSPIAFPINMSVKETADDGTVLKSASFTNLSPDTEYEWNWNGYQYKSKVVQRNHNGAYIQFLITEPVNPQNAPYPGDSDLYYSRYEGKVTHYSSRWDRYWNNRGGFYNYSYNYSENYGAEQITWGSQVKLDSSFGTTGDSTVYVARPEISLTPYEYVEPNNTPYFCNESSYNNGNTTWFNRYCREYFYRYSEMTGSAEFTQP